MAFDNEDFRSYFQELGYELPTSWKSSRCPSPREIRVALNDLPSYTYSYHVSGDHWSVVISEGEAHAPRRWVLIVLQHFSGDEDDPQSFYFDGGWQSVMLEVLNRLSPLCGPLALIDGSGATEIVVTPTNT